MHVSNVDSTCLTFHLMRTRSGECWRLRWLLLRRLLLLRPLQLPQEVRHCVWNMGFNDLSPSSVEESSLLGSSPAMAAVWMAAATEGDMISSSGGRSPCNLMFSCLQTALQCRAQKTYHHRPPRPPRRGRACTPSSCLQKGLVVVCSTLSLV
jgi:hypothetical protein